MDKGIEEIIEGLKRSMTQEEFKKAYLNEPRYEDKVNPLDNYIMGCDPYTSDKGSITIVSQGRQRGRTFTQAKIVEDNLSKGLVIKEFKPIKYKDIPVGQMTGSLEAFKNLWRRLGLDKDEI